MKTGMLGGSFRLSVVSVSCQFATKHGWRIDRTFAIGQLSYFLGWRSKKLYLPFFPATYYPH
jgi:hypothetical protein